MHGIENIEEALKLDPVPSNIDEKLREGIIETVELLLSVNSGPADRAKNFSVALEEISSKLDSTTRITFFLGALHLFTTANPNHRPEDIKSPEYENLAKAYIAARLIQQNANAIKTGSAPHIFSPLVVAHYASVEIGADKLAQSILTRLENSFKSTAERLAAKNNFDKMVKALTLDDNLDLTKDSDREKRNAAYQTAWNGFGFLEKMPEAQTYVLLQLFSVVTREVGGDLKATADTATVLKTGIVNLAARSPYDGNTPLTERINGIAPTEEFGAAQARLRKEITARAVFLFGETAHVSRSTPVGALAEAMKTQFGLAPVL